MLPRCLIVACLLLPACGRPPSVEELLAQAYAEERRFEWQLPAAQWSAVKSKPKPALERSAALVKAQAMLAARHDALLAGRADLIEARVDSALAHLPDTPEAWVDLAVAHGVSADRGGPAAGYAAAVEYTTRALAKNPTDKRALFNRALAFERLSLNHRALLEWQRYAQIETDPQWRADAERHREAAWARVQPQRHPTTSVPYRVSNKTYESQTIEWLQRKDQADGEYREVARNDPWLHDAVREQADSAPLIALAQANEAGRTDVPTRLDYPSAAPAHRLRARYELLYARSRRMEPCLTDVVPLARDARAKGYFWLALLTDLRHAVCLSMAGPPDIAIAKIRQVEAEAGERKLDWLGARAASFRFNLQIAAGDVWSTWDEDRLLMQRNGRRHMSILNYQTAAAQRGWYAAAYEFGLAAATAAAEIPNRLLEASNRSAAASHALAAGLFAEAAREAKAAQETYSQLNDPSQQKYLASLHVVQAKALLGAGQAGAAVKLLLESQPNLQTDDDRREANEALGLAYLSMGQRDKAAAPLGACIEALRDSGKRDRAAHRKVYRALASLLLNAGQTNEALRVWLEAHHSTQAPDIVWMALDDGYAVWAGNQFQRLKLDRRTLQRQAAELAQAAASPESDPAALRANARRIFAQLVQPVPNWNQPQLTLLPDGELAAVPLHLLVTPANQWWGADRHLIQSTRPANAQWTAPRQAVAFAVGKGPANLPPLTDAPAEALRLTKHWSTATRIDQQATAQALRDLLPGAELFHFSGHGWTTNDLGGIHLADAIVTPLTLRSAKLRRNQLSVLSACFSASGTHTGLANPDSLVEALLDAGAGTVLASRWAIDSAATRRWMDVFYEHLGKGQAPTVALQKANQSMSAEHPYYWAAFQLYR